MALKSKIHCCVPLCTQRGRVGPKGEQIGLFKFPDEDEMKKRWIHVMSERQTSHRCKRMAYIYFTQEHMLLETARHPGRKCTGH